MDPTQDSHGSSGLRSQSPAEFVASNHYLALFKLNETPRVTSPRPMPIESVNGLKPPAVDFDYFCGAKSHPFQPSAKEISAVNAWWLADASLLSYGNHDFISSVWESNALATLGYELDWIGEQDDNRGFVLMNETAVIVAFRGTQMRDHGWLPAAEFQLVDRQDLLIDSKFFPKSYDAGGSVHRGFLQAYQEVAPSLDRIVSTMSSTQKLWFTGHSLGGALAVIAATEHRSANPIVYTYGAPRVGDGEFASLLPPDAQWRFVHREDLIPKVPPEFIRFRHGGTRVEVEGEGTRSLKKDLRRGSKTFLAAMKAIAQEMKIDFGDFPMQIRGIADHAPIYYATHLWNSLIEPNRPKPIETRPDADRS